MGAAKAFQRYDLTTQEDGSIRGVCVTNDNLDRGEPSEDADWPVHYSDFEVMKKHTGLSHVGVSGINVTVTLDGERV